VADEEFMQATWRALCTHGYADLTMQDIADESERSKAALHYHYEGKADLLESFLDHVSACFLDRVRAADPGPGTDPVRRLDAVLEAALSPPGDDPEDIQTALLELKARAPHEPAVRKRVRETDSEFRGLLADILAAGVEAGRFRPDVDSEATARVFVTALSGAQLRRVSLGESPEAARAVLDVHIEGVTLEASG
jgi:AcrR family transcriptional regulator